MAAARGKLSTIQQHLQSCPHSDAKQEVSSCYVNECARIYLCMCVHAGIVSKAPNIAIIIIYIVKHLSSKELWELSVLLVRSKEN